MTDIDPMDINVPLDLAKLSPERARYASEAISKRPELLDQNHPLHRAYRKRWDIVTSHGWPGQETPDVVLTRRLAQEDEREGRR